MLRFWTPRRREKGCHSRPLHLPIFMRKILKSAGRALLQYSRTTKGRGLMRRPRKKTSLPATSLRKRFLTPHPKYTGKIIDWVCQLLFSGVTRSDCSQFARLRRKEDLFLRIFYRASREITEYTQSGNGRVRLRLRIRIRE